MCDIVCVHAIIVKGLNLIGQELTEKKRKKKEEEEKQKNKKQNKTTTTHKRTLTFQFCKGRWIETVKNVRH